MFFLKTWALEDTRMPLNTIWNNNGGEQNSILFPKYPQGLE